MSSAVVKMKAVALADNPVAVAAAVVDNRAMPAAGGSSRWQLLALRSTGWEREAGVFVRLGQTWAKLGMS